MATKTRKPANITTGSERPAWAVRRFVKLQFMQRGGLDSLITPRKLYDASRTKLMPEHAVAAYGQMQGHALDDDTPLKEKVMIGRRHLIECCLKDMAEVGEVEALDEVAEYSIDSQFTVSECSVRGMIKAEFMAAGGIGVVMTLRQIYALLCDWIVEAKALASYGRVKGRGPDDDTPHDKRVAEGRKRLIYRCLSDMKYEGEVEVVDDTLRDWEKQYRYIRVEPTGNQSSQSSRSPVEATARKATARKAKGRKKHRRRKELVG